MQTNTHQIMVMSFYYRLHIGSEDEDEECFFFGRNGINLNIIIFIIEYRQLKLINRPILMCVKQT